MRARPLALAALIPLALPACADDEQCGLRPVAAPREGPLFAGPCETFIDGDGDGETDVREVYRYDADDRPIDRFTYYDSSNVNGICRTSIHHIISYDEQGRRIREVRDTNADNQAEARVDFTYDGQGRLASSQEFQITADGERSTVGRTWVYDGDTGLLSEIQTDRTGNGQPEEILTYAYDDQGRTVSETRAADGLARVVTFIYEEDRLVAREVDLGADGGVDQRVELIYDGGGNLVTEITRSAASDRRLGRVEMDYSCW